MIRGSKSPIESGKIAWLKRKSETLRNMKNNCSKVIAGFASLVVSLITYHSVGAVNPAASIIYDNSAAASYLNNFFSSALEYGDEINFAGSKRVLTDISFEYNANIITVDQTEKVHFKVYNNDGLSGAPGTVLYDSNTDAPGEHLFNELITSILAA